MNAASAFGSGLAVGAVAGMIASHADGKLGLAGFLLYFLMIGPIKPGSNKFAASAGFVIAGAACVVLFRR